MAISLVMVRKSLDSRDDANALRWVELLTGIDECTLLSNPIAYSKVIANDNSLFVGQEIYCNTAIFHQ